MNTTQPVTLAGAAIVVVTTGVDFIALALGLDPVLKVALSAFLSAIVVFVSLAWAHKQVTPVAKPRLPSGSEVEILDDDGASTGDTVIVRPTPPGSTDIEGGASDYPQA